MSTLPLLSSLPATAQAAWSMPGVGEWAVILVIVLVIFGPGKLPLIGDALGKSIKSFKRAVGRDDEIDVTPPEQIPGRVDPKAQSSASATEDQHSRVR